MGPRTEDADLLIAKSDTGAELGRKSAAVDAALAGWRRNAASILLPATALARLARSPAILRPMLAIGVTTSLVMLASALLCRVDHRARLWAYFIAAYVVVALTYLVLGPALFLSVQPAVPGVLRIEAARRSDPVCLVGFKAAGMTPFLAVLVMLDRYHRFLGDALAAEWLAKDEVPREAAERQRLERECATIGDGKRRRPGQELHDCECQLHSALSQGTHAVILVASRTESL